MIRFQVLRIQLIEMPPFQVKVRHLLLGLKPVLSRSVAGRFLCITLLRASRDFCYSTPLVAASADLK